VHALKPSDYRLRRRDVFFAAFRFLAGFRFAAFRFVVFRFLAGFRFAAFLFFAIFLFEFNLCLMSTKLYCKIIL